MPILLAFGAIACVVFGGSAADDLSVIDVFLGYLPLWPPLRPCYGQDLAAGERDELDLQRLGWADRRHRPTGPAPPGKRPSVRPSPNPPMHGRHFSHFRTEY